MTQEERLEIAQAHAKRHNGRINVWAFVREASDPEHPAHDIFTWDDEEAAHAHRLQQARHFFSGIRYTVTQDKQTVRIPAFVAAEGNGLYDQVDTSKSPIQVKNNPAALHNEAVTSLRRWYGRYECVCNDDAERGFKKMLSNISAERDVIEAGDDF